MSGLLRPSHRPAGRCRPRLEGLESRLTPSVASPHEAAVVATVSAWSVSAADTTNTLGPYLTVVSTDPAPGAVLGQSPATISVRFDRPLDPFSYSRGDVVVQQKVDGAWVDVYDSFEAPDEALDAAGSSLVLTISQPLAAGQYRLVLPTGSPLSGADFSMLNDSGQDQPIAEFSVARTGARLADAADLGMQGPVVAHVADSLDLVADPSAYHLFKFTLQPGHRYRLGAEVSAQRIGSPLRSTLSLFDAQGRLLAVGSPGRPDAPADPFLFSGLAPGVYYLGVSGAGDQPGAGGYDPATGNVGVQPSTSPGGPFELSLVADVADAASRLTGWTLDHGDPLSAAPTGVSLAFSGLLNLDTLRGSPTPAFVLSDQNGHSFGLTGSALVESSATYRFLFNSALPAGRYTLRLADPARGGATDLAGYQPVAPGMPAGVLLTFEVKPSAVAGSTDKFNIGPLYVDDLSGLTRSTVVTPFTGQTYRFVTLTEGQYHLVTPYNGGALSLMILGPEGLTFRDAGPAGLVGGNKNDFVLKPGVHFLQFINLGSTPAKLTWTLSERIRFDSLLANGVGQGPALDLRLVDPAAGALTPSDEATPVGPASPANGQSMVAAPSNGGSAPFNPSASLAPSGLIITLGNQLVGRPTTEAEHVAAVGPGAGNGSPALASVGQGLLQGINYPSLAGKTAADDPDKPATPEPDSVAAAPAPADEAPRNGALVENDATAEPDADQAVIAEADWFARLGNNLARIFRAVPAAAGPAEAPAPALGDAVERIALARDDAPAASSDGSDRVEQAQLSGPLALGVISFMALRHHFPGRRWLSGARNSESSRRRSFFNRHGNGPHGRV